MKWNDMAHLCWFRSTRDYSLQYPKERYPMLWPSRSVWSFPKAAHLPRASSHLYTTQSNKTSSYYLTFCIHYHLYSCLQWRSMPQSIWPLSAAPFARPFSILVEARSWLCLLVWKLGVLVIRDSILASEAE